MRSRDYAYIFATVYVVSLVCVFCFGEVTVPGEEAGYTVSDVEYTGLAEDGRLNAGEIAEKLSVSAEHLSRQFKKDTGIAFSEYVNLLRFKKAEELLASGKRETIISIAHMCGFNDSNYFSSKFKKIYGVSPLKWRNSKSKLVETQK